MHLSSTFTLLATLVIGATAFDCPEADRLGSSMIVPSSGLLSPGQTITVTSNWTCSFSKGIRPNEVNYYIENHVNNNGFELPIFVARRTNPAEVDTFQAQIPITGYFDNANYSLSARFTYPVKPDEAPKEVFILTQQPPSEESPLRFASTGTPS